MGAVTARQRESIPAGTGTTDPARETADTSQPDREEQAQTERVRAKGVRTRETGTSQRQWQRKRATERGRKSEQYQERSKRWRRRRRWRRRMTGGEEQAWHTDAPRVQTPRSKVPIPVLHLPSFLLRCSALFFNSFEIRRAGETRKKASEWARTKVKGICTLIERTILTTVVSQSF